MARRHTNARRWWARTGRGSRAGRGALAAFLVLAWAQAAAADDGRARSTASATASGPAQGQTLVTLRQAAAVASDAATGKFGPVRVRDVAECTGAQAEVVGGAVVAEDASSLPRAEGVGAGGARVVVLTVADIRRAIESLNKTGSGAGAVNFGRLSLRGGQCGVTLAGSARAEPGPAPSAPARARPEFETVDTAAGVRTVKGAVAARLCGLLGVEPDSLQLKFDPQDGELLAREVGGDPVSIDAQSAVTSERQPVRVTLYRGDRIVLEKSLTVEVRVRRLARVMTESVGRGEAVNEANSVLEERWVSPGDKVALEAGEQIASRSLRAGQVVTDPDVDPPIIVKRGDIVWVHCLSGSVTVKAKARALGPARDGEEVLLRLEDRRDNIRARVSGPGRAVMLASDDAEAPADPGSTEAQTDHARDGNRSAR